MKLRLIAAALLLPLLTTVCAWAAQAAPELMPTETWLRFFLYLGSFCLGGYLVWWLTWKVWPEAKTALVLGFAGLREEIRAGFAAQASKLDELNHCQTTAHNDLFRELRDRRGE